jgi:hypothetical protein
LNLQKIHDKIIEKAIQRVKPEGYMERHHILPRSMGGTNDENNLVYLTGREHCIIHLLLAKIYNNDSMWYALNCMTLTRKIKSRAYEIGRKKQAEINSRLMKGRFAGEKSHFFGKPGAFTGKKHTEKVKKQLSELASKKLGKKNGFFGKMHTEKTKNNLREISRKRNSGKGNPMYGKKQSEETREKIRQKRLGKYFGKNSPGYKGSIQATCLKTGIIKILIGPQEIKAAGFNNQNVYACVNGKRLTHKNHTFIRLPINANEKSITSLPTRANQQSNPSKELGSVPTTGAREDSYDLDHYQRTVSGQDFDYCTQKSGGDGMGYRDKKVGTFVTSYNIQNHGEPNSEVIRLKLGGGYLPDKP